MQNINHEVGYIYDTLAFLSFFSNEISGTEVITDSAKANHYYVQIKQQITQKGISIPEYTYPFICKVNKSKSFLQSLVINNVPYSKCTYDRLIKIIKTDSKSKYIRFYYPNISAPDEALLLSGEQPDIISVIKKNCLEKMNDTFFLNSIYFYDRITESLIEIINILYKHISQTHLLFWQHSDIQKVLRKTSVLEKLQTITRNDNILKFTFSLSLLDAEIISFNEAEPEFILLGCDFTSSLENEYKYSHVTPLLFAQAIGNPIKYGIITALAKMQFMSTADMFMMLDYSKNEVDYNLNELRKSGIVVIDHVKGRQNIYKLDRDLIKIVAEQLLQYV